MAGEARGMRAVTKDTQGHRHQHATVGVCAHRREAKLVGEFRNERSDKFWWKSVLVDLGWAPGEAVHNTPHVFVCSLCVRL